MLLHFSSLRVKKQGNESCAREYKNSLLQNLASQFNNVRNIFQGLCCNFSLIRICMEWVIEISRFYSNHDSVAVSDLKSVTETISWLLFKQLVSISLIPVNHSVLTCFKQISKDVISSIRVAVGGLGVKNASFSEDFAYILNRKSQISSTGLKYYVCLRKLVHARFQNYLPSLAEVKNLEPPQCFWRLGIPKDRKIAY